MTHTRSLHTATLCSALQHAATHCNTIVPGYVCDTLPHTRSLHTLQHTAARCSTLQHAAAHCSTLQHTAAHCSTLQQTASLCNSPTSHTSCYTSYARFALIRLLFSHLGFVLLCAGESGDICKDGLVSYVRVAFAKGI